jgi:CHAT domain-containing protein/tetratricopeptide (TPR) repeat protein
MSGASFATLQAESARISFGLVCLVTLSLPDVRAQELSDGPRLIVQLPEPERARLLAERDRLVTETNSLIKAGKLDAAVKLVRKSIDVTTRVHGSLHEDVVQSLKALARLQEAREDWAEARASLNDVISIHERQPGLARWRMDDARRAVADLERRAAMAPDSRRRLREAEKMDRLATAQYRQGDFAAALKSVGSALDIRRSLFGEDDLVCAESMYQLGILYADLGEFARAEPLAHRAADICLKTLGDGHPKYALILNSLGLLYVAKGEYSRAEPLFRRAIDIRRKSMGDVNDDYVMILNNLGMLYGTVGDHARAEPLFRKALEITRKARGEAHRDTATTLNNLGLLYRDIGDFARAEPMLLQAIDIRQKELGRYHPLSANSLANLGSLYQAMGDDARAAPLLRQAMETTRQTLTEEHPAYATSLNLLGGLYRDMGDLARAEPLLSRALEIRLKALGEGHTDHVESLNELGSLYVAKGEYSRAEAPFLRATEISRKTVGEGHRDYAKSLANLGLMYRAMGEDARAEPLIREATEILSGLTRSVGAVLNERQRLRLLAFHRDVLDFYLSGSLAAGADAINTYRLVLDSKVADDSWAEQRVAFDRPELRGPREKLERARARLARLAFTTPPPAGQSAWRQELDEQRVLKESLESDLAARCASYGLQRRDREIGPSGVAIALPDYTVLVEVLEYNHSTSPENRKGTFKVERRLLAFVSRRGEPTALVQLGPARAINKAVAAWILALKNRQPDELRAAAADLASLAWRPLRPHLDGVRTVLIAPDGALVRFPFAALPGERPGSYLIEDLAIGYVASGRHAVEALGQSGDRPGQGLLAVGAVNFAADPGKAEPSDGPLAPAPILANRGGFKPLPATGPEAVRARDLFRMAFADQKAELLTGAEPTEGAIKRHLHHGRLRVVHLGTHGFFESPARLTALRHADRAESNLGLLTLRGIDDSAFALTPLLRSGLILTGGGRDPIQDVADLSIDDPIHEDGILTAEEVQALDMRGCELVVLSACDTGLGQIEHGQGVLGLQRAFHAAGARAVVASLWQVNDAATGVLMERFYDNLWTKKLSKLEALRQAQLSVLNDAALKAKQPDRGTGPPMKLPVGGAVVPQVDPGARTNPALWAAFILSGDGR